MCQQEVIDFLNQQNAYVIVYFKFVFFFFCFRFTSIRCTYKTVIIIRGQGNVKFECFLITKILK